MKLIKFRRALWLPMALVLTVTAHADDASAPQWMGSIGAGSLGAWNYVGARREVMLDEHFSWYLAGGLGTILFGGGAAYYSARKGNGVAASLTAGIVGANANLVFQFRLDDKDYLVAGASYGLFFMQYQGFAPVLAFERRF